MIKCLLPIVHGISLLANYNPSSCSSQILLLFKALRPHQWIKNLLVFVPLLAAHRFNTLHTTTHTLLAFILFCFTASSAYLLNDLIDIHDDRHHHRKRHRPFAAGHLHPSWGWILWPILLLFTLMIAYWTLPATFCMVLALYFLLTVIYTLQLKQHALLDVLILAGLYTLRIIAGATAINVPLSFWLLAFSIFIFLSLAFIKRFSELLSARQAGLDGPLKGRGYVHHDLELVSTMGVSAGYLAILVLALYIQDPHTAELYHSPKFIWPACPLVLYWISRAWLIAHRGQMHDDPIVFAIKDTVSWIIGIGFISVFVLAKLIG